MWKCQNCGREFKNVELNHFCGKISTTPDYIADQSAEVQPILQAIRETIKAAAPEAIEKIAWQMPTFWQDENLIHFAAHKKHISIYPGGEATSAFADRLLGYKTSKGAIQFPLGNPVDHRLITDIVHWRVEQVKTKTSSIAKPATRERYSMPEFINTALEESHLWERYNARPPYQRNDYIGWITKAKREETRQKRLSQMLHELQKGDAYMGMSYTAK